MPQMVFANTRAKDAYVAQALDRALDPRGGVAIAAALRRGKTKFTDEGLARTAASHSVTFSGSGNPMFGKSHWHSKSEEESNRLKKQISETLKNTYKNTPRKYQIAVCPHCGKSGATPGMTRYHFEKCKEKKT